MESKNKITITVEAIIKAPVEKVWDFWTEPEHITQWYFASDDWHAPSAENDLTAGGKFKTKMASKDGKMVFDFEGVYTNILEHQIIEYNIIGGRKVKIIFSNQGNETKVAETFEPENTNPLELQQRGWQAILDNFKKYCEKNK